MPEMHFTIEWPSGKRDRCYSPSYIMEEYLEVGAEYPLEDFLQRTRTALEIASERVRARYGFACSSALDQLGELQRAGSELSPEERVGSVKVVAFEKHPPRDARREPGKP
jgi:uncharacterized repeat protein (TIGR04042 family)